MPAAHSFFLLERDHEPEAAREREAAQIEHAPVVGPRFEAHDDGTGRSDARVDVRIGGGDR
jgi:hypothetical protein